MILSCCLIANCTKSFIGAFACALHEIFAIVFNMLEASEDLASQAHAWNPDPLIVRDETRVLDLFLCAVRICALRNHGCNASRVMRHASCVMRRAQSKRRSDDQGNGAQKGVTKVSPSSEYHGEFVLASRST